MSPQQQKPAGRSRSASNTASSSSTTIKIKSEVQSIKELLAVNLPITPAEVFDKLLQLEKRPLPTQKATTIEENPRCSCFDMGRGDAESGWVAHQMCERCVLLNQIMLATANNPTSAAYKALLGLSLLTTDCIHESCDCYGNALKTSDTPSIKPLAADLCREVASYGADDARKGDRLLDDSKPLLRALMHTSSIARLIVTRIFPPMVLIERSSARRPSINIPIPLSIYVMQLVEFWMLNATIKRYGQVEPVVPDCTTKLEVASMLAQKVSFKVTVTTAPFAVSDRIELGVLKQSLKPEEYGSSLRTTQQHITVKDACLALRQALEKAGPGPRFANAFLRTRSQPMYKHGAQGNIEVLMTLDGKLWETKIWRFATRERDRYSDT